jgi:uncharacterized protein
MKPNTPMKIYLLFPALFLIYAITAVAQEKRIEVEGTSEMKITPDEALISISLSEKALNTASVTNALNKKTKSVEDALKKSGVSDYTFVADNYFVGINTVYAKGSAKDSGYVASQILRITVKNTERDLVKIVETVQQAADMGFQLTFRISEEKQKHYQEDLLKNALADARAKASIIAATMELGAIRPFHIDYTSNQSYQPLTYRSEAMMMKVADARTEPTFSPEEQTISDRVKVVFIFE